MLLRCSLIALLLSPVIVCAQEKAIPQAEVNVAEGDVVAGDELRNYVAQPDDSYAWEVRERQTIQGCDVVRLHLTSQSWKSVLWRHMLVLIKPPGLDVARRDAVLVIGGGSWKEDWPSNGPNMVPLRGEAQLMASVAQEFGCVIGVLTQVPFQPIMGGKYEDQIIAATFAKFMETQDTTWPLLLPMVKSAVRGMDAATEAAQSEWGVNLEQFTVTGASKRGWTTWLTGAVDPRATVIAPMVIDMLNMGAQMKHQVASFGEFSEQIGDYTELDLPKLLDTPRGRMLQGIVDPFSYRAKLAQPKLLIFGTNDRYWPIDACNLYWESLPGEKHLLYVPNQGHGIEDYARVIGSLSAVHRSRHGGTPLPNVDWAFATGPTDVQLEVEVRGQVDAVRGWVATAPTRDFREAKWEQRSCRHDGNGTWTLAVGKPPSGFIACFSEVVSIADTMPAFFSTNVKIFGGRDAGSER